MILVCGEALIDLFVEAEPHDAGRNGLPALAVAGGSPFNLAIGLRRLGVRSGFFGSLSSDAFGRMLANRLAAEGVDLTQAKASGRPTPLAVIATAKDGHPAYTFHADGCAHADISAADVAGELPDDVVALAMGSLSLAAEPAGSAYTALAARETGRRVISLDPNVRPSLIPDFQRWHERFARLVCQADIIKLSDEDRIAAFGADTDERALAARWLATGPVLVVVTAGAAGATAYHACGRFCVPARPVRVADTVGAGDAFHAALLAHLARRGRLTRAGIATLDANGLRALLAEATIAASITCSRRGAELPTLADLNTMLTESS